MSNQDKNFENSLKNLETIVGELDRGDLPLEKSLARYQEGIQHLKQCYQILDEVKRKIVLISRKEDGSFEEVSFADIETSKNSPSQQ
jgi:exodeoxyribonuclease VII small subunit